MSTNKSGAVPESGSPKDPGQTSFDLPPVDSLRLVAALGGGAAALLGVLGLLGWISGLRLLASISPSYIPMAPDTALLFVLLGSILLRHLYRPWRGRGRSFALVVVTLTSIYGLLKLIEYFAGVDLTFSGILFPISEKLGSFPLGRMSPITGALFCLCGCALALNLWAGDKGIIQEVAAALASLVFVAGFVGATGYLYGTPLLYGSSIIPLAVTTTLAFFMLGGGLLAAAGPGSVILRPLLGGSVRARLLRVFLPLTVLMVLAQGFLSRELSRSSSLNLALVLALWSLVFMVMAGVAVTLAARGIGRALDRANVERKHAEARIRKLNRVYAVLSEINQAIVRLREPRALFEQVCHIAVEVGGFRMAWVGLGDEPSQKVQVVARVGGTDAYFEEADVSLRVRPVADCPINRVLCGGQRAICNVIGRGAPLAPCQEIALQLGFRSSAAFPLLVFGKIRGTVNLYSDESDFFDEEEIKLLDEMALNLSFAMEVAEKEAERKRAEEEIQILSRFPAENPNPVLRLAKDGGILYANPSSSPLLNTWGCQVGQSVPEDWRKQTAVAFETGLDKEVEIQCGQRIFSCILAPVPEAGYVNVYGRDITERKHAEEHLAYLASFPEQNPNPLVEMNLRGQVTYLSPAAERLFPEVRSLGLAHPLLAGVEVLVPQLESGEQHVISREVSFSGTSYRQTVWYALDRGLVRLYSTDITERVQGEEVIRQQLAMLSTLYVGARQLSENLGLVEVAESVVRTCVETLGTRLAWLGHAEADGSVQVLHQFPANTLYLEQVTVRWDDSPLGQGPTGRAIRSGSSVIGADLRNLPGFAPWREAALSAGLLSSAAFPLVSRGQPVGALSLYSDQAGFFTPERVELFQAFADQAAAALENARLFAEVRGYAAEMERRVAERTAELQAANKELEAFSYSVSHDLRAPLRALDGFSRILLEEHAPQLADEAQHYLRLLRRNAQQMGQLIDDLLSFSRLSRQPLRKQPVAPAEVVRRVWEELRAEREGRRVEFALGELPECQADPALLKQVYANLLANALKFTRKREVARIEVGCREEAGQVVYFVKDNGVGFDMQYAHKLFGVFQRLRRAEDYEGTGVGLALVQRIVQRHGGRAWAKAEVDKGAEFCFTLGGGAGQ